MTLHDPSRPTDDRGFSLIEMLVAIVVLGILATVVVFAVRGGSDDAEAASYAADERTIVSAQEAYAVQHGHYGDEDELVAAGFLRSASTLHDVELDGDRYRIVRSDGGSESADGNDETGNNGDDTGNGNNDYGNGNGNGNTGNGNGNNDTGNGNNGNGGTTTTTVPPSGDGVTCAVTVTNAWGTAANANLTITNSTERRVTAWTVRIDTDRPITPWNATTTRSGSATILTDARHNAIVAAGATATPTGMQIDGAGLTNGQTFPCTVITPKPSVSDVTCRLETVTTWWGGGGAVRLTIDNRGSIGVSAWTVRITTGDAPIANWSEASVAARTATTVTLTDDSWNALVPAGGTHQRVSGTAASGLVDGQTFPCAVVELA